MSLKENSSKVLLIPGWGFRAEELELDLEDSFDGVLTFCWEDLGKHIKSTSSEFNLESLRDFFNRNFYDSNSPKTIIGWSCGAILALDLIINLDIYVQRAILFSPTPKFLKGESWRHGASREALSQMLSSFKTSPLEVTSAYRKKVFYESKDVIFNEDEIVGLGFGLNYLSEVSLLKDLKKLDKKVNELEIFCDTLDKIIPYRASVYIAENCKNSFLNKYSSYGHSLIFKKKFDLSDKS